MHLPIALRSILLISAATCLLMTGCDGSGEKVRALEAENARLRQALEEARGTSRPEPGASDAPELNVTLGELWAERFGANQQRAKRRLDRKQVRVTAEVENLTTRSVTLVARHPRFGPMSLVAQFDEAYARAIGERFNTVMPGTTVTVQGRFLAERTALDGASFVERASGRRLTADDFQKLEGSRSESPPEKPATPVETTPPAENKRPSLR